jgi:phosphate ABC transporter phosphate-binding protein
MSMVNSANPMNRSTSSGRRRVTRTARKQVLSIAAVIAVLIVTATPAAAEPSLQSTGSSFAGVAIQQWVGQSATLYGLSINWQVSSSVVGLNNFAQNQVDFAASDIPYSAQQSTYYPTQPYQYMPDVAGGLSFMFNLNGVDGQRITNLDLDTSVIAKIFLGEITNWNDPAIARINPQLVGDLPNQKIIPVYRSDASGENYLLSDYLLHEDNTEFVAAQNAFNSGNPNQPSATWPVPAQGSNPSPTTYPGWGLGNLVGQSGSDNAANYVAAVSSVGSITYVETAYAKEHGFPYASLYNASGNAVQPGSTNVSNALKAAILYKDLTQNLENVYTNPDPTAYPLSAYSYLVTPCSPQLAAQTGTACASFSAPGVPPTSPKSPLDPQKGQEIGKFVAYLACAGQEQMTALGYSPIPGNLVREDFAAIARLNGGQEPPPPTPANCPDPALGSSGPPVTTSTNPGQDGSGGSPNGGGGLTGGGLTGGSSGNGIGGSGGGSGGSSATGGGGSGSGGSGSGGSGGAGGANGATGSTIPPGFVLHNGQLIPKGALTSAVPSKYPRINAFTSAIDSLASPNLLRYFGGALLVVAIVVAPALIGMTRRRPKAGEGEPTESHPGMAP